MNQFIHELLTWVRGVAPQGQLVADSRRVHAGDVFLAFPGDENDGRRYIADALKRGAAGVIFESEGFTGTFDAPVPHRAVMGLKPLVGPLASAFYGHPSDALTSIAVTGTNGKTTCAYWSALGMQALGFRAALVGTLGAGFVDALESTGYTTPDAVLLQQRLAQLRADGADALAIEASSIGLDERRLLGMRFDVAVFTNLTRDHLDWHGSMEAYEASKAALFDWPGLHGVVINVDDAAGQRYWQRVQQRPDIARLRCIAYSIAGAFGANLRAENIAPQAAGTRFEVVHGSERHQVTIGVIGDYNVANWLACLGALLALPPCAGAAPLSLSAAIDALRDVRAADGRVQLIGGQDAPLVVVDYAHTPDALDKILRALRPVAQARGGRLISVFGCGGDRDRGKRPQMAQLSAALADLSVLTSDNPRTEDPQAILADMRAGLPAEAPHWADADRRAAIQRAIGEAAVADVVLIAGKGHERTQEIAGVRHPFYDPDEARIALAQRNEAATC